MNDLLLSPRRIELPDFGGIERYKKIEYEHIKDTFYYGLFGDFRLVIDNPTCTLCVQVGADSSLCDESVVNRLLQCNKAV